MSNVTPVLRALACASIVPLVAACPAHPEPPSRIALSSSLRPVDPARPMVVFGQLRGKACGNDAVAGAIRNLKRLSQVDGYIEVVLEETGENEGRCASVTAYPFRYGTSMDLPGILASGEIAQPVLIAGRAASPEPAGPGPAPFDCSAACQKLAALVATGTIEQSLAKERCITRCSKPDSAFQACIQRAVEAPAAKACLTP